MSTAFRLLRPVAMALTIASVLALSGCVTSHDVKRASRNSSDDVYNYIKANTAPQQQPASSDFAVSNGFYAAAVPLAAPIVNQRQHLPAAFQKSASITPTPSLDLSDVVTYIRQVSGYDVSVDPDVAAPAAAMGGATQSSSQAIAAIHPLSTLLNVNYKGNLVGLLDYVTGQLGVSWKWDGKSIQIFRTETRQFRLTALGGDTTVNTNLVTSTSAGSSASGGGGASTGSGSTGSSGQSTKIITNFDMWKDVTDTLKGSLSAVGTMTVAQSAGLITVRDTPASLNQIGKEVEEFNRVYGRQVMLDVEVYSVERDASDANGLDWNIAWGNAAHNFGLDYNTVGTNTQTASPTPTIKGTISHGPFSGSSIIMQALSSIGHTTLMTSGTVSTLNGQSVPLNVSREQAYLASYSTTLSSGVAGGASTTTLTPGVVVDGFSMHFTPKILENNDIMMRFSVDLSTTDQIITFTAPDGTSAIQLPRRSVRDFLQNVDVHDGESVVLAGFQQTNATQADQGPFNPENFLMGGQRTANSITRTIVIVVTPHLIAPAAAAL